MAVVAGQPMDVGTFVGPFVKKILGAPVRIVARSHRLLFNFVDVPEIRLPRLFGPDARPRWYPREASNSQCSSMVKVVQGKFKVISENRLPRVGLLAKLGRLFGTCRNVP